MSKALQHLSIPPGGSFEKLKAQTPENGPPKVICANFGQRALAHERSTHETQVPTGDSVEARF